MTTLKLLAGLVTLLTWGTPSRATATTLVDQAINTSIQGDDPFHQFLFEFTPDPTTPISVHFDGFIENLGGSTGARYDLWWTSVDGATIEGFIGGDFTQVDADGQLPISFEQDIGFTPSTVVFLFEGGGPSDHLRIAGSFAVVSVPEPSTLSLAVAAVVVGVMWRVRRSLA